MRRLLLLTLLLCAAAFGVRAEVAVPPVARVSDLTGTLTVAQQQALSERLAAFERAKGSQIAVLVLPTTAPETIEQYGIRVAETWKLGRKGVDDGVLLLVALQDRAVRIEVGYGLEGAVPDAIAKRIIEETILPRFRAGDVAGGIGAGVEQLMTVIEGEPLPPPKARDRGMSGEGLQGILPMLLFAALGLGQMLRRLLGPALAGFALGGGAFLIIWLVVGTVAVAIAAGLVMFFLTVTGLGGAMLVGMGRGGGGGGGGLGGGGFSGGGGGFGGGGASGRW